MLILIFKTVSLKTSNWHNRIKYIAVPTQMRYKIISQGVGAIYELPLLVLMKAMLRLGYAYAPVYLIAVRQSLKYSNTTSEYLNTTFKYFNTILKYLNMTFKYFNTTSKYLNTTFKYFNTILKYLNTTFKYFNTILEYLNTILEYLNTTSRYLLLTADCALMEYT